MQTKEGLTALQPLDPAYKGILELRISDNMGERQTEIRSSQPKLTEPVTQGETGQASEKNTTQPFDSKCTGTPDYEEVTPSTSSTNKESHRTSKSQPPKSGPSADSSVSILMAALRRLS